MKINKEFKIAVSIGFCYVGIGTYELFSHAKIANYIDSISDGLDLYTIFPAHIFGTILWGLIGGGNKDTIFLGWIGQIIGLIFYSLIFYVIIKLINTFRNKPLQ
jgi:hypothetical protein